jgi:5'-nucleotidase/UDP-sugar diphosphatase
MMKTLLRNSISVLTIAFLLLSALVVDGAEFVIFHTSDTHGSIAAHKDPLSKEENPPLIGGFPALKSLMNRYKADPEYKNARILYFDSGDAFQGTPIVDRTKGGVMIDMMNQVPVNVVTLGNHEFDYTYEMLIEQMQCAQYPIVCCNVFDKETKRPIPLTIPYTIFAHEGKKIGVIGFDAPETASITFEKNVERVYFEDPTEHIKPIISLLRRAGVDFIIALSHIGYENDLTLVRNVPDIDLILGGHSHTLKRDFTYAGPNNTPIVHSGSSCENTSIIRIKLEDDKAPEVSMVSVPLYIDDVGEDPELKKIADGYLEELNKEMARIIGYSEVGLYRGVNGGNSPEGTFIGEAMMHCSDADFAFTNAGGIRRPLQKGKISIEDVFLIQPFDNFLEILEMTGEELLDTIERSVSNEAREVDQADKDDNLTVFNQNVTGTKLMFLGNYGYLYAAGLKITFDPFKKPLERVIKVTTLDDKPLVMDKTYKVAFSDFLASGGDGYTNLRDIKVRTKTDLLIRDAMIKYIGELGTIKEKPAQTMFNIRLVQNELD